MKLSLKGHQLPESKLDFTELVATGRAVYLGCFSCNKPFTEERVKSVAAWRETQISGMCETCYDDLFSDVGTEES